MAGQAGHQWAAIGNLSVYWVILPLWYTAAMSKKFPLHPKHPERICWGCDKYCPATDLQCGNGSIRIEHPCESGGDEWYRQGDWSHLLTAQQLAEIATPPPPPSPSAAPPAAAKPHIVLRVAQTTRKA